MADETNVPNGGEPPKIKLNPGKTGNGHTDKIKLTASGEEPPKIQIRSSPEEKKSTTRIDLGQARPPISAGIQELSGPPKGDFYNKSTIRIDTLNTPKPPSDTQRVPGEATPVDTRRSTIRIDGTAPAPSPGETSQIVDPKKSTVRTDLPSGSTQPMSLQGDAARLVDQKRQTMRVDQPATAQPGETAKVDVKRSTIRIDAAPAGATQPVQQQGETARIDVKKSTIRIDAIPQTGPETRRIDLKTVETGQMLPKTVTPPAPEAQKKSETTRLELPAEVVKRQTGRIQIPPSQEPADVFKRRTGPVGIAPIVPLTPQTAADTIARPKTIQVRRPPRPSAETPARPLNVPPAVPASAEVQAQQARKSETARLEIPKDVGADDRPVTRPKTIRIKRPDGTTARKPLQIARPTEGEASEVDHMPEKLRGPAAVAAVSDAPGGVWTILAIAAFLMLGLLVYIIVAGDFMHDLPMWGRLV